MFTNVFYQQDNKAIYLHLDGVLRLIPSVQTFKNLFGVDFSPNDVNQFPSAQNAPYTIQYPISSDSRVYTLSTDKDPKPLYFADVFPWNEGKTVFRRIVSKSQLLKLGFSTKTTSWTAAQVPSIEVPLAVDSRNNWDLQATLVGNYELYSYLCHKTRVSPFFASWVVPGLKKERVKATIAQTQEAINQLKGEVRVERPVFNPAGGYSHFQNQPVTITCPTPKVTIYYTTNGTDPIVGPGGSQVYQNSVALPLGNPATPSMTLKAIAECYDSIGASPIMSATYTYSKFLVPNPTFSPAAGDQKRKSITVSLSCVSDTTIYYTTDGTDPTTRSTVYTGSYPLDLSESERTVRALATHHLYGGSSSIASATYRFVPSKITPPTFSPTEQQQITPSVFVTVSPTEPDSIIRYTTVSGQNPGSNYETPVRLVLAGQPGNSATISAQATNTFGSLPSDIASKTYSCSVNWTHAWPLSTSALDAVGNVTLNATEVTYACITSTYNAAKFNGKSILTTENTSTMQQPVFSVSACILLESFSNSEHYAPVWVFEEISSGNDGPGILIYEDGRVVAQTIQQNKQYVLVETPRGTVFPGPLGGINFFVLVADGKNLNLYINGKLAGAKAYDGTLSKSHCGRFNIGAEKAGGSDGAIRHQMSGYISKVYYANVALTAEQVTQLCLAEQYSGN